jgi:hypothetical protein
LKTLRDAPDLSALKDAVLKVCGPRGPAISHEFIFHSEKRSVSCVLEMKYALPDSEMREFAAYGFANVVCLDFELAGAQHQGLRAGQSRNQFESFAVPCPAREQRAERENLAIR